MGEENVAEVVARLLAEQDQILGLIECGTGGVVGRRLFDTEEGPAVLSDSLNVETVEDAIDLLALPEQQFKAMGSFSPKAARAAAREGRSFLDVTWCLAVWAEPLPAADGARAGGQVQETIFLALNTGEEIREQVLHYGGAAAQVPDWLGEQALSFLWTALRSTENADVS
jgi:nicotinamide mononucleotide (NMN) deamidase PncC